MKDRGEGLKGLNDLLLMKMSSRIALEMTKEVVFQGLKGRGEKRKHTRNRVADNRETSYTFLPFLPCILVIPPRGG